MGSHRCKAGKEVRTNFCVRAQLFRSGPPTHDDSLRGEVLCTAAHHAELDVEAALTELNELPTGDWKLIADLRDEVKVRLGALESKWRQTAAWIDGVRKDLTFATSRAAELSDHRGGVAGAFVTFS